MTVRDLSYRRYEGPRLSRVGRIMAITAIGIRLGLRRRFLILAMLLAVPFAFLFGVLFYYAAGGAEEFLRRAGLFYLAPEWQAMLGPNYTQADLWALLVNRHFYFSLLWALVVIPWVGPSLLADDFQSRALSIYFSKPIARIDYLVGKWAVLGFFVACVTLVPSLVLYVISILLSRDLTILRLTWGLVPAVFAWWALVAIVGGLLMMAFSASGLSRAFAAAGWLMTVLGSEVLRVLLQEAPNLTKPKWAPVVSLWADTELLGRVFLGVDRPMDVSVFGALGLLLAVAAISAAYVWWRVRTVEELR